MTPIAPFLAMKTGGSVSSVTPLTTKEDVERFVTAHQKIIVLGGGSNTLFKDGEHSIAVGLMKIRGITVHDTLVTIGAGENWDNVVAHSIEQGLSGLEALSAIPGTIGAAPIQNIGAYGSEIKDTLESVEAFDAKTSEWIRLTNAECEFSYRDSIFKRIPGRYIIVSVSLRLRHDSPTVPDYKDVREYFKDTPAPSLKEIRQAIIEIRSKKLPDPSVIPNCGSFFKNPFVTLEKADLLKIHYPHIPLYPDGDRVKVGAGWLIQECGLKGQAFGHVGVYPHNALVLTAESGATTNDVLGLAKQITETVQNKFGVTLEREPILLP